eukprot:9966285-Heterocapsa_arctica.AAC.1
MDQDVALEEQFERYLADARKAEVVAALAKEPGEILEQYIVNRRALELAQEREAWLKEEEARVTHKYPPQDGARGSAETPPFGAAKNPAAGAPDEA